VNGGPDWEEQDILMATTRIQIGPTDQGRKMTLDEFHEAEETSGFLYELARGTLVVTEIPGDSHGQIVDNLHEALSLYRRDDPDRILRIAHGSDVRLIIPELESDRHPDLGVILRDSALDDRGRRRAALAIEVVSPGSASRRRDYEEKREEYLAFGLREYWIVDPFQRQVTVLFSRGDAANAAWEERVVRGDEAIPSELLPSFVCRVSAIWVDAE
jgi:Uma2 family endonuclease